jgi:hypothetical protein
LVETVANTLRCSVEVTLLCQHRVAELAGVMHGNDEVIVTISSGCVVHAENLTMKLINLLQLKFRLNLYENIRKTELSIELILFRLLQRLIDSYYLGGGGGAVSYYLEGVQWHSAVRLEDPTEAWSKVIAFTSHEIHDNHEAITKGSLTLAMLPIVNWLALRTVLPANTLTVEKNIV